MSLTKATVQNECAKRYVVLHDQLKLVYDTAIKSSDRAKYPFEQVMEQVDIYVQSVLLGLALSDRDVDKDEIDIINGLTKYGNIFKKSKIDVEKTNFNGLFSKIQINKVAETNSKAVPAIFVSIAEYDRLTGSDAFSMIAPRFIELLCFFLATDGSVKEAEKNKLRSLMEPLFKLFPNSKAKL